jgi:branched-chain amino acid transport system substrate-binding protein
LAFAATILIGASPSQAKEDDEIVICAIDSTSGDFSIMSTPKHFAYQMAAEEINEAGGIFVDGMQKKIKVVGYDGQSTVKRYQELAQKCVYDDEADVVFAAYTGAEREAARREVIRAKTIYWHNNQGEGGIADKYSFFTGPIPEQQILTGVEYMINTYGPKMYVLAADYGFGQVSALWTHVAAGLFGGEIVGEEFIPLGNSEFAASIANVQKAKPDFMVHYLVGANQSQFYPQAQAVNLGLPAISTVNLQQGYEHRQFSPPSLANMYIPVAYIEEIPTDANAAFIEAWRAKWPDEPYINQMTRCAYVAIHLMALAWERAGTTETQDTISALESGLSFDAPEGPVFLDPATHHLTMDIRMGRVNENHDLEFVHDFGAIEPWWLRTLGVNLVRENDGRQYLPWDDARYEKYKQE